MKNKLLIFLIIFFSFLFLRSLIRSNSIPECGSPCTLIIKPRQMGEIGGDHFFEDMFQELLSSADENHVNHQIYVDYYQNNSDGLFYQTGLWRNLQAPPRMIFEFGKIYMVEVQRDVFNRQFVKSSEEFDLVEAISADAGQIHQIFYDLCWEYDCKSKVPPYKKLSSPKKILFLRGVKKIPYNIAGRNETYYKVASDLAPPKPKILPLGEVNVAIVTLYEDHPPPEEEFAILKSDVSDKSFNYVSAWYKKESEKYFGKEALSLRITFIDKQIPFRPDENYQLDDECFKLLPAFFSLAEGEYPRILDYDVIVFFFYGEAGRRCEPHIASRGAPYIFLFDLPPELKHDNLVRSLAHELGHVFHATDKYIRDEEYQPGFEAGCWYESDKPEELGRDIMCHHVPTELFEVPEGLLIPPPEPGGFFSPPLSNLIITEQTAKEIGWYDLDGDGVLEVGDPCPWDKENLC